MHNVSVITGFCWPVGTQAKSIFHNLLKCFCFAGLALFLSNNFGANQAQIVIHCTSQTINGHPNLLKNSSNEVLSAGSTANGDGCLVTLGYYSTSDSSSLNNHFNGDWIPLTEGTRIGDSSSGYGFEDRSESEVEQKENELGLSLDFRLLELLSSRQNKQSLEKSMQLIYTQVFAIGGWRIYYFQEYTL